MIKTFESFIKGDQFHEITVGEYSRATCGPSNDIHDIETFTTENHVGFTQNELNKINSIYDTDDGFNHFVSRDYLIFRKKEKTQTNIIKSKDEYFYVLHYNNQSYESTRYKCDQLYGLINCLKQFQPRKINEGLNTDYEKIRNQEYHNAIAGPNEHIKEDRDKFIKDNWEHFTDDEIEKIKLISKHSINPCN